MFLWQHNPHVQTSAILTYFVARQRMQSVFTNIYEPSIMKRQYDICYSNKCQICLSQKLSSPQAFLRRTVYSWWRRS